MKCFDELFSRDEFRMIDEIKRTYDCGYIPVCFNATDHVLPWCSSRGLVERTMSLKFYYATQVWCTAVAMLKEKHSYRADTLFGKPVWKRGNEPFMFLDFERESGGLSFDEAVKAFFGELENVADSGKIKVSEGVRCYANFKKDFLDKSGCEFMTETKREFIIDDYELINRDRGHHLDLSEYKYNPNVQSYKWDGIRDFFVQLTPRQLSLRHYRHMTPVIAKDSAESKLFNACSALDLEGVKSALTAGANPNALSGGESPITACIYAVNKNANCICYSPENDEKTKPLVLKAEKIIDFLLANGADIDFFGADGCYPMQESFYAASLEIMKFLLERGANPNHHAFLTDSYCSWYESSSVLSTVITDICLEDPVPSELEEMEKILLEAGAKRFIDGFDPDEYCGE